MDNGNVQRAVDILDAASQAFPDNINVRKAVAGGYGRVGRAKESLSLYKTIPMQDATAGDFQGAVGAALAANDKAQAEIWLRQALDRYPRDPAILSLAARFEQARGDNQRAADFYRASLAAMPTGSPTARLAHELFYPEQDTRARRAVTAADLQHLLDPDYEPFAKTTKLPPLPAYGADPYNGLAPVVLTPGGRAPGTHTHRRRSRRSKTCPRSKAFRGSMLPPPMRIRRPVRGSIGSGAGRRPWPAGLDRANRAIPGLPPDPACGAPPARPIPWAVCLFPPARWPSRLSRPRPGCPRLPSGRFKARRMVNLCSFPQMPLILLPPMPTRDWYSR